MSVQERVCGLVQFVDTWVIPTVCVLGMGHLFLTWGWNWLGSFILGIITGYSLAFVILMLLYIFDAIVYIAFGDTQSLIEK